MRRCTKMTVWSQASLCMYIEFMTCHMSRAIRLWPGLLFYPELFEFDSHHFSFRQDLIVFDVISVLHDMKHGEMQRAIETVISERNGINCQINGNTCTQYNCGYMNQVVCHVVRAFWGKRFTNPFCGSQAVVMLAHTTEWQWVLAEVLNNHWGAR